MAFESLPLLPKLEHVPGRNGGTYTLAGQEMADTYSGRVEPAGTVVRQQLGVVEWIPVQQFQAQLEILPQSQDNRGRTVKRVEVVDRARNIWYSFFAIEFFEAVRRYDVVGGVMDGTFTFVRKGEAYSLKAV